MMIPAAMLRVDVGGLRFEIEMRKKLLFLPLRGALCTLFCPQNWPYGADSVSVRQASCQTTVTKAEASAVREHLLVCLLAGSQLSSRRKVLSHSRQRNQDDRDGSASTP